MHVALIASAGWLDDELLNYRQLVVGLIDEQVRVTQVLPRDLPVEDASGFAAHMLWPESRWWWVNRMRLRRFDRELTGQGVELIHAMDVPLWSGALALGRSMNVPVILNVNSPNDVRHLVRLIRSAPPMTTVLVGTSEPVARLVEQAVAPAFHVATIGPGVHPGKPVRARGADDALCAVVSGSGRYDQYYEALLHAMVDFIADRPQAQFFFDGRGSDQHALWQAVSRLGLLANVSLVPRRLGHHELLVRADVLIHPQPAQRVRSLTLQAMANGVPVIALDDPWADHLIDGQTAWVVPQAHAQPWLDALNRVVRQPGVAAHLGQRALAWIREHRLASQQGSRALYLYRSLTGETLKMPAREAG